MSTDVLRFPVIVPPREGTLTKRLAAALHRGYDHYVEARLRKARQEIDRHNHVHLDAAIEEAELATRRLGSLPFVR